MIVIDYTKETIENLKTQHNVESAKHLMMIGARNSRIKELEEKNKDMKEYIKNGIELGYIDDREGEYKKFI